MSAHLASVSLPDLLRPKYNIKVNGQKNRINMYELKSIYKTLCFVISNLLMLFGIFNMFEKVISHTLPNYPTSLW